MAETSSADIPKPAKPRWYVPTPAKFLFAVLVMQGVLYLSSHYHWFWFNERKGYTVLITVGATAIALLVLVEAVLVSRFFKSKTQFSLATLLLMVPVMGIPCAWLARELELAKRQRETLADLERRGGTYAYEIDLPFVPRMKKPSVPTWLVKRLGREFFEDVYELRIPGANNADLKTLKSFPELRCLMLDGATIDDADVEHLRPLRQLRYLVLDNTPVSDAGLEPLTELHQLIGLYLAGTRITDAGMKQLEGLNELRFLGLPVPPITAKAIGSLRRALPNCETGYTGIE